MTTWSLQPQTNNKLISTLAELTTSSVQQMSVPESQSRSVCTYNDRHSQLSANVPQCLSQQPSPQELVN